MKMVMLIAIFGIGLSLVATVANANEGVAVYYNPPYNNPGSACYGYQNEGIYVAGLSSTLWRGKSQSCGKYYTVKCIGGANLAPHPCKPGVSVTVKVVDFCRSPCNGDINLSLDAFRQIADPTAGKVRVQYTPL